MKYREKHIELMNNIVVPLANEDDAEKTAAELSYFDPDHVTAVFVVEETENYPNKSPITTSEEIADEISEMFESHFPETEFRIVQSTDVIEAVIEVAEDVEASSIVFRPSQTSTITRLLSGNKALKLVTNTSYPVVALPEPEDMD